MKRRDFITTTALGSAAILGGLPLTSFAATEVKKITILHTNDVHSHIDPFPVSDPKYPNMGGAARRAEAIAAIRRENPNVLLFDAGDIFQGTPYFNYYGGELEFKLMSMMQYDLATLGNHDFDNGLEGFKKPLPHANFSFVSANYDFRNTILEGLVQPYKIFEKDGIKIGVFGLGIELNGLVEKRNYGETIYNDPLGVAQDMARQLRHNEKCHLVICLSHLGFMYPNEPSKISDITLAANTRDIDLIIGGHTHTFLNKPHLTKNVDGNDVLINQVGCYGLNLGQVDFYFEDGKRSSKGRSITL